MKTYEYYFTGIDCPDCASKVEQSLNKHDYILEARVNFLSKKIIITFKDKTLDIKELEQLIKKLEPDAELSEHLIEKKEDQHS